MTVEEVPAKKGKAEFCSCLEAGTPHCFEMADINLEIVLMMNQQRFLTEHLGGIFPEGFNSTGVQKILDIACGPGAWVLDMAAAHQKIQVFGIDNNPTMIQYARAQAFSQGLDNANFILSDMHHMTHFAKHTFDLVNIRFITEYVDQQAWNALLQEFLRVCRPGGTIRWTEAGLPHTNSNAYKHWLRLTNQANTSARRLSTITPIMDLLLQSAGCIDIQQSIYSINFSAGTPAFHSMYRNFEAASLLTLPWLVEIGIASAEQLEQVRQQVLIEMLLDDFGAIWPIVILSAKKPERMV